MLSSTLTVPTGSSNCPKAFAATTSHVRAIGRRPARWYSTPMRWAAWAWPVTEATSTYSACACWWISIAPVTSRDRSAHSAEPNKAFAS